MLKHGKYVDSILKVEANAIMCVQERYVEKDV